MLVDESMVSDLHKDAYGFRPREAFWSAWERMTPSEKQSEWDSLCRSVENAIAQEVLLAEVTAGEPSAIITL